jgi:hypothetical protein
MEIHPLSFPSILVLVLIAWLAGQNNFFKPIWLEYDKDLLVRFMHCLLLVIHYPVFV